MNDYKPLTDEELHDWEAVRRPLIKAGLDEDTRNSRIIEQARRANALAAAVEFWSKQQHSRDCPSQNCWRCKAEMEVEACQAAYRGETP